MKLRDFVVNSLPRVRGKKKTRTVAVEVEPEISSSSSCRYAAPPPPPVRVSSLSRESSVERSSHVAVADARIGVNPQSRINNEEAGAMGPLTYYGSPPLQRPPPPGMVLSHSVEGISSQSMAIVSSRSQQANYDYWASPYAPLSAYSEGAVSYSLPPPLPTSPPTSSVMFQTQHHHRHNHQHDYHYIHHHHHHHQCAQPELMTATSRKPLVDTKQLNNQQISPNVKNGSAMPATFYSNSRKSEPGFLKKSFASFRAMRKQRSNSKDMVKSKCVDENNGKCLVCPYPQRYQYGLAPDHVHTAMDVRASKPKRKGLKNLRKSKASTVKEEMDKSWYSDNDAGHSITGVHHYSDHDLFLHSTMQRPRVRECSVESCMSRLNGSQDGYCASESDYKSVDAHSLSGCESELPRSKTGRTRTRIKTNPWLPSPQPSLNMARRFEQCDYRESREDFMTIDDDYCSSSITRSASFDNQRTPVLSSFQTPSSKGRTITRHRSLTPSDLNTTLPLNKSKRNTQSPSLEASQATSTTTTVSGKISLNDLNISVPKSRPTSILSPSSEFVILADNIEQLANNISFEYEDVLESNLECVPTCQQDGKSSIQELLTDEELVGSEGKNVERVFSNLNSSDSLSHISNSAHSPDSGIGGLGSSDGDELAQASINIPALPQSPQEFGFKSDTHLTEALNSCCVESTCPCKSTNTPDCPTCNTHLINCSSSNDGSQCYQCDSGCPSSNSYFLPDEKTPRNSIVLSDDTLNYSDGCIEEIMQETANSQYCLREDMSGNNQISNDIALSISNSIERDTQSEEDTRIIQMSEYQKPRLESPFSETELSSWSDKNLPPNIKPSEITNPIASPTENWQVDNGSSILPGSCSSRISGSNKMGLEITFPHDPRNCDAFKTNQVQSKKNPQSATLSNIAGENIKAVVDKTLKDDVTGSTCSEWVDACVQTDFKDDDFPPLQNALDNLCDSEFDAMESTRRWLLTGNMQGSADTGYSSQPRDSQILMDDDESIPISDTANDGKPATTQPCVFAETYHERDSDKTILITDNDEQFPASKGKMSPTCSEMKQSSVNEKKRTSNEVLQDMFSGIESQFKDIFHQIWSPNDNLENVANKRDSSGSSTSTLISEPLSGGAAYMPLSESAFKNHDTRKIGCIKDGRLTSEYEHTSDSLPGKKLPKKKKTSSKEEPDYVNLPRKGRPGKANSSHSRATNEPKGNEHLPHTKKCSVISYPHSRQNFDPLRESYPSPSSHLWDNKSSGGENNDSADYLTFLKDAPLGKDPMSRSMFLIPGFGPIDMSSPASLSQAVSSDWKPPSTKGGDISHSYSIQPHQADQVSVHRVQSLIFKGRSGMRSKISQDRDGHNQERKFSNPSVSENHSKVNTSSTDNSKVHENIAQKIAPSKPKRKNPRGSQPKTCPVRIAASNNSSHLDASSSSTPIVSASQHQYSDYRCMLQPCSQSHVTSVSNKGKSSKTSCHLGSSCQPPPPNANTRSLVERINQLQQEKDLIYIQLREVQQDELCRQRQQLQHHRNIHSHRKEMLLQTLRELKANLEEQSRQLDVASSKDVFI